MKCPVCWAERAYIRRTHGWKDWLMTWLLFVPMKCHHCYHRFYVWWFFTIGKQTSPPTLRISPGTYREGPSTPEELRAGGPARLKEPFGRRTADRHRRADAA
jgi:hypothetical protein